MKSSLSPETKKTSSPQRYEGLDALRGLAAFGVVWGHTIVNTLISGNVSEDSVIWLKLRDFSLPMIVMSSYFVLTLSMLRKSESKFSIFFTTRFKRLWLPLFIWTSIYCLMWAFVMPKIFGGNDFIEVPSIDAFIGGYMHLWFLQFIFLGSLIVYPLLRWLKSKSEPERIKIAILFFLAAAVYAVIFKLLIQTVQQSLSLSKPSYSLMVFTIQSGKYAFFIPIAIGIGLLSNKINSLYKLNAFRICSLIAVLFTLIVHLTTEKNTLTAPMYGIAVFMAALQPWKRIPFRLIYISAAYSYGIYILHFFLCEALQVLINRGKYELDSAAIFSIAVLFYVMSLGASVLLRKIIPVDWFMPLVPIEIKRSEKKGNP
jgi:peptidoglycan/LPS O-acetylase OafA/YrhL